MVRFATHSLLLLILVGSTSQTLALDQPNILLIVADDLGFSDLGCYGGEISTPHLDQLASSGLRLTQFYNTGRCCPSRASLLTGQYAHRVGLGHMTKDIGHPGYRGTVSDNATTIAEVLLLAGYRTFISGKWHLGTDNPTRHGFEEFFGTLNSAGSYWDPSVYLRLPVDRRRREYGQDEFYGTDALTDHALDFITLARETPRKPWFLYLAYNAPHFPLQAPQEDIQRYKDVYQKGWDAVREERMNRLKELNLISDDTRLPPRSRWWNYGETQSEQNPAWNSVSPARQADLARRMAIYAAMIDRMDANIGRIVSKLKQQDAYKNTLIVFLSDNGACAEWDPRGFDIKSSNNNILHRGEQLDRMGSRSTYHSLGSGWANACNTPWRLYKHFCHEGGISSPCIVHWPIGLQRRGELDATPSHVIDLLPTCIEVAGARYPAKIGDRQILPLPGLSLVPALRGLPTEERTLYFEHEGNRAIREGPYKLSARKGQSWSLYHVETDRTELEDRSSAEPEQLERLAAKWQKWARENHVTPFPIDYGVRYFRPAAASSHN